jgi:hypothetical protein
LKDGRSVHQLVMTLALFWIFYVIQTRVLDQHSSPYALF